ncbi:MAG: hypothetical protein LAP61_15540 [Acidobacteriia bacterium]|nr:hypothetical protein [Terriglobia bacterium]
MRSVQTDEIAQLDEFLDELGKDELGKETEAKCGLLREHLESARVYLLGLMPAEYALSLKMAEEALDCVSDPDLRNRIEKFIHGA